MRNVFTAVGAALIAAGTALPASAAEEGVFVGHLADYTGATAFIGKFYGQGITDALTYLSKNGGIKGTPLKSESVD
ncbi:MAG: branched-chain amino acid ABC transporter substrate-binding protein, partial [Rhodospirillales bacterium]|nr:branched-chain amino acid ABC transporter substrate-binding protein [Rhodospirillales bacterium]